MKCPECGHELEVMLVEKIENNQFDAIIHREVIAHCRNCLCDWQWEVVGKEDHINFRRKFWG